MDLAPAFGLFAFLLSFVPEASRVVVASLYVFIVCKSCRYTVSIPLSQPNSLIDPLYWKINDCLLDLPHWHYIKCLFQKSKQILAWADLSSVSCTSCFSCFLMLFGSATACSLCSHGFSFRMFPGKSHQTWGLDICQVGAIVALILPAPVILFDRLCWNVLMPWTRSAHNAFLLLSFCVQLHAFNQIVLSCPFSFENFQIFLPQLLRPVDWNLLGWPFLTPGRMKFSNVMGFGFVDSWRHVTNRRWSFLPCWHGFDQFVSLLIRFVQHAEWCSVLRLLP